MFKAIVFVLFDLSLICLFCVFCIVFFHCCGGRHYDFDHHCYVFKVMVSWRAKGVEKMSWAERAAVQGERGGFYLLGVCCEYGHGCEIDLEQVEKKIIER
jgi:hypothetical protein